MRFLASILTFFALSAVAQEPGVITRGDLAKRRELVTFGPLDLYVETTGNDANDCQSPATPCLTIQGALEKVPKRIRHPVNITVGQGTFAGAVIDSFEIEGGTPPSYTSGAWLKLQGILINFTPATGSATGTATGGTSGSGSTFGTLVDSSQTWTPNNLRGRLVEITGGPGAGQIFPIASNTATTITVCGVWEAPAAGSTYAIRDWGTTINTVVLRPPGPFGGLPSSSFGGSFVVANTVSSWSGASVAIARFRIAHNLSGNGIIVRSNNTVEVVNNRMELGPSSTYSIASLKDSFLTARANSVIVPPSKEGIRFASASSIQPQNLAISNYIEGGRAGIVSVDTAVVIQHNFFRIQSDPAIEYIIGSSSHFATGNRIECEGLGGSGIWVTPGSLPRPPGFAAVHATATSINNCFIVFRVVGLGHIYTAAITGSGNTFGYLLEFGGRAAIASDVTVGAVAELRIDGESFTFAQMRAQTPKAIGNMTFGSMAYE